MMNASPLPVQRSLLSASALAERVLTNYNLPGSPACHFWSRSINDTYLVTAGETKFILRVAPTGWRTYEHLAAEIDLLRFLHRQQIPAPQPIPQTDGTYVQTLLAPEGPRYAVAFTFVPNASSGPMTEIRSNRYGQAIAQLHVVTDNYPADQAGFRFDPQQMVDEPLARLKPLFAEHQADFDYLLEISAGLKETADKLPRSAPEYGICHGDVNNGNIHFNDYDDWALIDFEYFGYGWRVFDIATFINNQVYNLDKTKRTKRIRAAFLEGYQSVHPLSDIELEVLPAFVMLRQIWLLGVGARYWPNIGLGMFQDWVFKQCMASIRAWMAEPW